MASLCNNLNITLAFEKNANFFAQNCQKSQKIVIKTSTPKQMSPGRTLAFGPGLPDGMLSNQKSKFG
jgi:hypothetical protein